ncbi:MAG: NADH-quinone oxidoreductase subunit L, partial [Chloroflexi bacterium]
METLAPFVLLSPLAGFLVNALFGRLLPRRVVGWIGAGSVGIGFIFSLNLLLQLLTGAHSLDQTYFTWWQSGDFSVPFNLYV